MQAQSVAFLFLIYHLTVPLLFCRKILSFLKNKCEFNGVSADSCSSLLLNEKERPRLCSKPEEAFRHVSYHKILSGFSLVWISLVHAFPIPFLIAVSQTMHKHFDCLKIALLILVPSEGDSKFLAPMTKILKT